MYRVDLRRRVQQSLDKLPDKDRQKIIGALLRLKQDPRPKGVEKIRGTEFWRTRQGNYRVIYHIADKEKVITVVRIGHRRDIYRGI